MLDLENLIQAESPKVAKQILEVARDAVKEEDLRTGTATALAFFAQTARIRLEARHEYTIGKGRADSVYSLVVIEYKIPGSMTADNSGLKNREVIDQLKDRFVGLEKLENRSRDKMFGVGTDGFHMVFVRFRGGEWNISDPIETSAYSVEILLRKLSSIGVQGKALTVENLTKDFGENSNVAIHSVPRLLDSLTHIKSKRAEKFYSQWKQLFGAVCGYDLSTKKEHIQDLAKRYKLPEDTKPDDLLFAIHSYYAIFMKLLMSEVVSYTKQTEEFLSRITGLEGSELKNALETFEASGLVAQTGIKNFMEGDLFSWYISEWDLSIEQTLKEMIREIHDYDPSTLSIEPDDTRDLLKGLYQYLIDRPVRHDLGEFYTPDWLADIAIDEIGYDGDPRKRMLDPACGSGTFLVEAINKVKKHAHKYQESPSQTLSAILENVVGFDLNPLAVMAARTNYVIALGNLLRYQKSDIEIPVYLCDSIVIPEGTSDPYGGGSMRLATEAGVFEIPTFLVERQKISIFADCLEKAVHDDYDEDEFLQLLKDYMKITKDELEIGGRYLRETYSNILSLEKGGINGIWSRIIKNGFAPIFKGKFDFVIGNPPWVNWENLPEGYRNRSKELWKGYGLFSLKGYEARLGGGRKDVSTLFVYRCADRYLEPNGRLAFLITQTVFKSGGAGAGFRRFRLNRETPFKVLAVNDYVEVKPFEDASNMTALMLLRRGATTTFPVPYYKWKRKGKISSQMDSTTAKKRMRRIELVAMPVNRKDSTSQWFTVRSDLTSLREALGPSKYEAFEGANSGGANGIYWVKVKGRRPNRTLLVENMKEVSLNEKLKRVERTIEPDLLFPLMKSRNCRRWNPEGDLTYSIISQDPSGRVGIPEDEMKRHYRNTYSYLKEFESELKQRASKPIKALMESGPFYSMFGVSEETMVNHKVVWSSMGSQINACVVSPVQDEYVGKKPVVPEHVLNFIVCGSRDEAFFICGILNSVLVNYVLQSYSVTGGKNFAPTRILEFLNIPRYSRRKALHKSILVYARELSRNNQNKELEGKLNRAVLKLYGLDSAFGNRLEEAYAELNS